jgi:DnaK suppressor protein
MTQTQRHTIKAKIIEELTSLEREINDLQELCKPISPECALGDLARFELMNDQIVSEKALKEAKVRKNRLNYALSKIDKDDFGLCIECEEEIAYKRLLLLPEATHCIKCASQQH